MLLIPGILACLIILLLLPPSLLTQFNLVWIFLFHLPINLAKSLLQSGSIHNVQMMSNIKPLFKQWKLHQSPHSRALFVQAPNLCSKTINHAKSSFVKQISNKSASCQTGSRSFWSLAKVVSQHFCHSSFLHLKTTVAHLHALLPLKLAFSHQPLLPIPILMTKSSKPSLPHIHYHIVPY